MQQKISDLEKHLWLDLFTSVHDKPNYDITLNGEIIYSFGLISRSYDPSSGIDLTIEKKSEQGTIKIEGLKINGMEILPLIADHTNQKSFLIKEKGIWHLSISAPFISWYKIVCEKV